MPRAKESDLKRILLREKYGIKSSIGKGAISSSLGNSGKKHDLEPASSNELEGPKGLQISYTGKVCVSIKFYRHRLADYDTGCSRAISEKSIIDCLLYSGIIRGDSEKEIWLKDQGQEKVAKKEDERIELTIEYQDVDFDHMWVEGTRTDGR